MSRLRELRLAAGLTQVQLAEASRLPQETISRAERGQRPLSVVGLDQVAAGLELAPAQVVELLREQAELVRGRAG